MNDKTTGYDAKDSAFLKEVVEVINRHSMENTSNTPDFMLAEYLLGCLTVYENTVRSRDDWWGNHPKKTTEDIHVEKP